MDDESPQLLITDVLLDSAEQETQAQATIIRVLRRLQRPESRAKVMLCVAKLLEAEQLVPGVLATIGIHRPRKPAEENGE